MRSKQVKTSTPSGFIAFVAVCSLELLLIHLYIADAMGPVLF